MDLKKRIERLEQMEQTKQDKNNGNKMANMVIRWADGTLVFDGRKFKGHAELWNDPAFNKDCPTIELPDNGRDRE